MRAFLLLQALLLVAGKKSAQTGGASVALPAAQPALSKVGPCFRLHLQQDGSGAIFQLSALPLVPASTLNASSVSIDYAFSYGLSSDGTTAAAGQRMRLPMTASLDGAAWSSNITAVAAVPDGSLLLVNVSAASAAGAAAPLACVSSAAGFVVGLERIQASSQVPPLFLYCADPATLDWDAPAQLSVVFDAAGDGASYYGNVSGHRAGSDRRDTAAQLARQQAKDSWSLKSKDWPKRKILLSFHNETFRWRNGTGSGVHKIELRSMYRESVRPSCAIRDLQLL